MSFDIPVTIAPEISRYAQAEHITENEAIIRLIQAGLNARAANATSETKFVRTVRRGPRLPVRTEDAESIIGMFAGKQGFQESIDAVIATRTQRYTGQQL